MNTDVIEEPIRVVVELTRRDVFFVGFRCMLRVRGLWALCALGFASCLWSQWHSEYAPTHWLHVVFHCVFYGVVWLAALVAGALGTGALTVAQASAQRGVLGPHTFEIRDEGFFESTSANETLTRWSAIPRAIRTDRFILISLAWWTFHYLPRRAFPDATAYDAFFHALQQRISPGT